MTPARDGDFLEGLGVGRPVVQAGMAGGVAGGELAGAVSAAGGLGTVGMMGVRAFALALATARERAQGRPVAANLLVPFIREGHVRACVEAGVALVVLHGGRSKRWVQRLRSRGLCVFVTVGDAREAQLALADGASGLVVQGSEAGGHLLGVEPIERALPRVLEVLSSAPSPGLGDVAKAPGSTPAPAAVERAAGSIPVLAAGGVSDADDVRRLLDLGASAAIAGTRFLLTEESRAHPLYKQRVLDASRTLDTELFGFGWPLRHRVVPNAATERWCARDERGPRVARLAARCSAPLGRITPMEQMSTLAAVQRTGVPLYTPALPLAGMPDEMVDRCALYAGESALRMDDLPTAAEAVERLAS